MSLLALTLNPALDKVQVVPGFTAGAVYKVLETHTSAGGKGINVARVTHTLGGLVTALGLLGGVAGDYAVECLRREGIPCRIVPISGETRTSVIVADPANRRDTVLNEAGPDIRPEELNALWVCLRELLPTVQTVSYSGSLPLGVPGSFYASAIALAREIGVKAALDTSGDALVQGAAARPFLLKPNRQELAALGDEGGDGWVDSAAALRGRFGCEVAIVTDGARGSVLACGDGIWECAPPVVEVVSAVGSGDSFLAGFLWAWDDEQGPEAALRWATAAGAANARHYGSGVCTRDEIETLVALSVPRKLG